MQRTTTMWAAAALATAALAGCGSDSAASTESTQNAYCQQVQAFKTSSNALGTVFTGSSTPTPDAVKNVFTTMQEGLHALDKNPPAAIKADVDAMTKDIDTVVDLFSKHNWDVNELSTGADADALKASLNDPAAASASTNLQAWAATNCGITADTVAS